MKMGWELTEKSVKSIHLVKRLLLRVCDKYKSREKNMGPSIVLILVMSFTYIARHDNCFIAVINPIKMMTDKCL